MYYETEELWFPEWELAGRTSRTPNLRALEPDPLRSIAGRPPLVVHGGLDFRIPMTQGLAVFTALQRRGIQRFLYSPTRTTSC